MKEYETYTLDDNTTYLVYDSVIVNQNKYLLLSDVNNPANICFRKEKNGDLYTISEEEYVLVLNKFLEKNENLF